MQMARNYLNASPHGVAGAANANIGQNSVSLFGRPAPVGFVDTGPHEVLRYGKVRPTP